MYLAALDQEPLCCDVARANTKHPATDSTPITETRDPAAPQEMGFQPFERKLPKAEATRNDTLEELALYGGCSEKYKIRHDHCGCLCPLPASLCVAVYCRKKKVDATS